MIQSHDTLLSLPIHIYLAIIQIIFLQTKIPKLDLCCKPYNTIKCCHPVVSIGQVEFQTIYNYWQTCIFSWLQIWHEEFMWFMLGMLSGTDDDLLPFEITQAYLPTCLPHVGSSLMTYHRQAGQLSLSMMWPGWNTTSCPTNWCTTDAPPTRSWIMPGKVTGTITILQHVKHHMYMLGLF